MEEKKLPVIDENIPMAKADLLTSNLAIITVDVPPRTKWEKFLHKIKLRSDKKTFRLGFLTPGNVIRISKLIYPLKIGFEDLSNMHAEVIEFMATKGEVLTEIAAICLHNQKSEPPESLKNFIRWNFTANEMYGVLTLMVNRLNVQGFTLSILSVHGANVLQKRINERSQKIEAS